MSTSATAEGTAERERAIAAEPLWPTLLALAVLTAALAFVAGPTGVVAGLATALAWYGLGTPYALAAGHVVLAAAFSGGVEPDALAIAEVAFVAVLLVTTVRPVRRGDLAVALASTAGLVGIAWFVARTQPLWIAAGSLLTVFALAAYAVHRYERVRLGLVPLVPDEYAADTDTDTQPTDT